MRRSLVARSLPIRALACALAACALAAWACAAPAGAQTVSGRVVERETGSALTASLVELLDSAGVVRAAVLSDFTGAFVVRATAPGRYRVRAEHIGRETVRSEELQLGVGAATSVRLAAPIAAILLQPLVVTGRNRCKLRPDAAEATARLWEEARKALRVARLARRSKAFAVRRFEHILSPRTFLLMKESGADLPGASVRPIASTTEVELDSLGYVHKEYDAWVFWAPDEEVLLSDGFLDHHCIELRNGGRQRPGLIGLAFKPVRRHRRDIQGTAWLNASTAELKYVEFEFTNLPWDVPAEARSGLVQFRQLPSGGIVIGYWYVRMPVMTLLSYSGPLIPGGRTPAPRDILAWVVESGAELLNSDMSPIGSPK